MADTEEADGDLDFEEGAEHDDDDLEDDDDDPDDGADEPIVAGPADPRGDPGRLREYLARSRAV